MDVCGHPSIVHGGFTSGQWGQPEPEGFASGQCGWPQPEGWHVTPRCWAQRHWVSAAAPCTPLARDLCPLPPVATLTIADVSLCHAAMIDETTGGLVYELKKAGKLGPGSAFTVRLEVGARNACLLGFVITVIPVLTVWQAMAQVCVRNAFAWKELGKLGPSSACAARLEGGLWSLRPLATVLLPPNVKLCTHAGTRLSLPGPQKGMPPFICSELLVLPFTFLCSQVDYKRPMPASADVVCSARVESVEGRKVGHALCSHLRPIGLADATSAPPVLQSDLAARVPDETRRPCPKAHNDHNSK